MGSSQNTSNQQQHVIDRPTDMGKVAKRVGSRKTRRVRKPAIGKLKTRTGAKRRAHRAGSTKPRRKASRKAHRKTHRKTHRKGSRKGTRKARR